MQSNNFEFVDAGLNSPPFNKIPSFSNISSLDLQKKLPDIPNAQKANQTLRFDTTQIRFFVDKAKTVSIIPNKNKPMKESSKQIVKNSVKGESEKNAFERISEKLSEKQSSSKSSISKQQSQDSKEEFRTSDQSNLKDNDFHKKKTSFNPLENSYCNFLSYKNEKIQVPHHKYSESMKVPVKSRNDINLIKSELIENIIFDVPKDNCKEEKKLNSIEVNSNIKKKESLFNSNAASFHIQKPLSVPLNNFPSQIIKKPPGLLFNSVRSKNLVYQPSNKKNYSMMSSESTHDSENVTNTLTSSNSGHLENFASLTLGKSDLNSSGKLDSSIELSGRAIPSKSMYISSTNQRQNINPNEFQLFMSSQKNQKNNMSNSSIKNKLNQSVNDGFGYNFHGFSNMYCNSNNPNQSMTIDNEIEELYEQEDENNREIFNNYKCSLNIINPNVLPTVISSNVNFFKENPRHRTKTEAEEDSKLFEVIKDEIEEDGRTTLMIKNIPNKYNIDLMLQSINKNHKDKYDFFYLPIDFRNRCNVGYAFINFIEARYIRSFYEEFNGKKWTKFNSEKICTIKYARIQGRNALITHFKSSSVMNQKDTKLRPLILPLSGKTNLQKIINQQRNSVTESYDN